MTLYHTPRQETRMAMVHTVTLSARRGPIDASPTQDDKDHHVEVQDRFCCHHYDASEVHNALRLAALQGCGSVSLIVASQFISIPQMTHLPKYYVIVLTSVAKVMKSTGLT